MASLACPQSGELPFSSEPPTLRPGTHTLYVEIVVAHLESTVSLLLIGLSCIHPRHVSSFFVIVAVQDHLLHQVPMLLV